ncbi:hypothetical protein Trydic_g5866 [Trypoxylus dichotomus]
MRKPIRTDTSSGFRVKFKIESLKSERTLHPYKRRLAMETEKILIDEQLTVNEACRRLLENSARRSDGDKNS